MVVRHYILRVRVVEVQKEGREGGRQGGRDQRKAVWFYRGFC